VDGNRMIDALKIMKNDSALTNGHEEQATMFALSSPTAPIRETRGKTGRHPCSRSWSLSCLRASTQASKMLCATGIASAKGISSKSRARL
jgi:hypothetical protein